MKLSATIALGTARLIKEAGKSMGMGEVQRAASYPSRLLESFNSARTGDYPVAPPWGRDSG